MPFFQQYLLKLLSFQDVWLFDNWNWKHLHVKESCVKKMWCLLLIDLWLWWKHIIWTLLFIDHWAVAICIVIFPHGLQAFRQNLLLKHLSVAYTCSISVNVTYFIQYVYQLWNSKVLESTVSILHYWMKQLLLGELGVY